MSSDTPPPHPSELRSPAELIAWIKLHTGPHREAVEAIECYVRARVRAITSSSRTRRTHIEAEEMVRRCTHLRETTGASETVIGRQLGISRDMVQYYLRRSKARYRALQPQLKI